LNQDYSVDIEVQGRGYQLHFTPSTPGRSKAGSGG